MARSDFIDSFSLSSHEKHNRACEATEGIIKVAWDAKLVSAHGVVKGHCGCFHHLLTGLPRGTWRPGTKEESGGHV